MKIILWIEKLNDPNFKKAMDTLFYQYGTLEVVGLITPPLITPEILKDELPQLIRQMIPLIDKNDLPFIDYDLIVTVGKNANLIPIFNQFEKMQNENDKIKIDFDLVVPTRTICMQGFTLERYKKLRKSKLTIFASNCWGGITYNTFGLPFLSPTINMFTNPKDFLKFLSDPMKYIDEDLKFNKMMWNSAHTLYYPVFHLGDIQWHMLHYKEADDAKQKWQERSLKINWFNVLVCLTTNDHKCLSEFDELPYAKKICIVPFKSNIDSAFYIDYDTPKKEHWQITSEVIDRQVWNYDLWDLLLYGKKTSLN